MKRDIRPNGLTKYKTKRDGLCWRGTAVWSDPAYTQDMFNADLKDWESRRDAANERGEEFKEKPPVRWHTLSKVFKDADGNTIPARPGKNDNRGKDTARKALAAWVQSLKDEDEAAERAEAERMERERLEAEQAAEAAVMDASGANLTVREYLERFVRTLALSGNIADSTVKGYRGSAKYPIAAFGNAKFVDVTRAMVQDMINGMVEDGLSAPTVHKAVVLLSMAYENALEDEIIEKNPCRKVKRPSMGKATKKKPNCLDADSRAKLVKYLESHEPTYTITAAALGAYGGLRVGECCALRWRCIDFERNAITVYESIGHGEDADGNGTSYINEGGKTEDATRELPMIPQLAEVLKRRLSHIKAQAEELEVEFNDRWFVLSDPGETFRNPIAVSRAWKILADNEGFKGTRRNSIPFHDLRHTFISVAVAGGSDVASVSDAVGHSDSSMTLDIYSSALPEAKTRMGEIVSEQYAKDSSVPPSDTDGKDD